MVNFLKKFFGSNIKNIQPNKMESETEENKCKPGFYADLATILLPEYILPGHGFLITRDLIVDELICDGFSVGNPNGTQHPYFTGSFRGFFNVPPGSHKIIARKDENESIWDVDVNYNKAHVKRISWNEGGWVNDDPETENRYCDLALSGSMLKAKTLRPWPLVEIYLKDAPADIMINGKTANGPKPLYGIFGLMPGKYRIETDRFKLDFEMPPESMQLISFSNGKPEFIEPSIGVLVVRSHLLKAQEGALIPASWFGL